MASFSRSGGDQSPLPRSSSPLSLSPRDWEATASALLEDGLVLTALELHTELLEGGKEVATLRDYFSNPGNFEHALPQPPSSRLLSADMGEGCTLTYMYVRIRRQRGVVSYP